MAVLTREQKMERMRQKILNCAAILFLEKGYEAASLKEICEMADVNIGSLINIFNNKENILCALVEYVLEHQFKTAGRLLEGVTNDKILFYAAETTMQLYMAESSEQVRELYAAAYSMPHSSAIIQHNITGKLEQIFKEHLPDLETKDFYELEIASGGIMRSFMTIPCDMYFTMDRKVRRFLETTFLVYRVSDEKINEAIEFVKKFDFALIAQETISQMLKHLETQNEE